MRCFKDVDQLDQAFKFAVWGFFVNRLECKLIIEILEMGYIGLAPTEESFFFWVSFLLFFTFRCKFWCALFRQY